MDIERRKRRVTTQRKVEVGCIVGRQIVTERETSRDSARRDTSFNLSGMNHAATTDASNTGT
jgi:hypothetical protein